MLFSDPVQNHGAAFKVISLHNPACIPCYTTTSRYESANGTLTYPYAITGLGDTACINDDVLRFAIPQNSVLTSSLLREYFPLALRLLTLANMCLLGAEQYKTPPKIILTSIHM